MKKKEKPFRSGLFQQRELGEKSILPELWRDRAKRRIVTVTRDAVSPFWSKKDPEQRDAKTQM